MNNISVRLQTSQSLKQPSGLLSHNYSKSKHQQSLQKIRTQSELAIQHRSKMSSSNIATQSPAKTSTYARIKRIYCRSGTIIKQEITKNNRTISSVNDPEQMEILQVLSKKVGFIPGAAYNNAESLEQKWGLYQKQNELKRRIYEQKKNIDKLHIRNRKLVNALENGQKNIQFLKGQSRQNLTLTCLLALECSNLDKQLDQAQVANQRVSQIIYEQQSKLQYLNRAISKMKTVRDQKSHRLGQLKQAQQIHFKKLFNLQMKCNQLYKERTLWTKQMDDFDRYC